ncbi:hypothetical protein KIW84_050938 [Lathyrus oleraceus]|uniref:Nudix hydrolase domain-containing protein n=1 Tax=Pisum sativum TaxID=3888 RepID=A0A9D4WL51_PEA|nr:hypothetical protein KIW84_050938 [Pisum sativum]
MAFTSSLTSHFLSLPNKNLSLTPFQSQPFFFPTLHPKPLLSSPTSISTVASASSSKNPSSNNNPKQSRQDEVVEVEVEEELPWIQEKALDLVEFTGSVTQAIPGPRVGPTSLPWILAVPLGYAGLTFVIAFVKTVRKFSSPKAQRRKLTGFVLEEILRKYIRYALNEKPFNPDVVADLIQLRRASALKDSQVAEILNEISRRIVRDKGNVFLILDSFHLSNPCTWYVGVSSSGITYKSGTTSFSSGSSQSSSKYGGFGSRDSDSKSKEKTSSRASKSSVNASSVPSQSSSVTANNTEDDFDDFDPRGTSTTHVSIRIYYFYVKFTRGLLLPQALARTLPEYQYSPNQSGARSDAFGQFSQSHLHVPKEGPSKKPQSVLGNERLPNGLNREKRVYGSIYPCNIQTLFILLSRYHHAESDYLMLVYWIPDTPDSIPANASHRVGVGAFVVNNKREVLVVQETSGRFGGTGVWKMPTGAVNEGEDICDAVIREVKEETGSAEMAAGLHLLVAGALGFHAVHKVETKAHMVLVAFSSSLNSQDSCSFAGTGIQTCDGSNGGDNLSASSL